MKICVKDETQQAPQTGSDVKIEEDENMHRYQASKSQHLQILMLFLAEQGFEVSGGDLVALGGPMAICDLRIC